MKLSYKQFINDYQIDTGDLYLFLEPAVYFQHELNNFVNKGYPRHVAIILVIGKAMEIGPKIMFEVIRKPTGNGDISGEYAFFETYGVFINFKSIRKADCFDIFDIDDE